MKTNKPSTRNGSYKRLFECMKPYQAKLIVAIVVILLASIAYASAPLLMGNATDSLAKLLVGGEMDGVEQETHDASRQQAGQGS